MAATWPTVARCALLLACLLLPASTGSQAPAQAPQESPAERELQRAIESAGNDRTALARNLEEYLRRFPDSPHRQQVYRALIEVCLKLEDRVRAIEFAERFIALAPEDSAMMLLAAELLEEQGDAHSLTRATGYLTRILDRVEKEQSDPKVDPEWMEGRTKLVTAVYLTRARLEISRRLYPEASDDLAAAEKLTSTAEAQLLLGEIAELNGDYLRAADHYIAAYLMPDSIGRGVDRTAVRRRMVNVWRLRYGSDAGLDERVFAQFSRSILSPPGERRAYNPGVTDPFAFRLRLPSGGEMAMAAHRGKLLVLHFWATWCAPCREVEPLFDQAAARFEGRDGVVFLAVSVDSDEQAVKEFLRGARIRIPVAFADGLDRLFQVPAVPTVLIVSPAGRVVHRRPGFVREQFVEGLVSAVERHLARP